MCSPAPARSITEPAVIGQRPPYRSRSLPTSGATAALTTIARVSAPVICAEPAPRSRAMGMRKTAKE
jgi:hypothetical protein